MLRPCGTQNNNPPKMPTFYSLEPVNVTLCDKKAFADVIKLRLLKWGHYPGFFRWLPSNHKGGRRVREEM